MIEERKLAVLRAIIQDYVETSEPVGSKALVERHSLGVSPATVRNDMAALEEEGYTATRHQHEVGAGYFDQVLETISGGAASTLALSGSTEEAQFEHDGSIA